MLRPATLHFLTDLRQHNSKDWMDANRERYLAAREDFEAFTETLLRQASSVDPSLAHLRAKDCIFRINRDIRFSANKAPYKTNFACFLSKGGKKSAAAGYYLHVEPGQCFFAAGVWMPPPEMLRHIRQEIDYGWKEFSTLLCHKKFKAAFGDLERQPGYVLSRPPKGYDTDNPAIEYLKLKCLIASAALADRTLTGKGAADHVAGLTAAAAPFVAFLNRAYDEMTQA